jgi:hypothetical protein
MVFGRLTPSFIGWVTNVGFNGLSSGGGAHTFRHTHFYYVFPKASQAGLEPVLTINVRLQTPYNLQVFHPRCVIRKWWWVGRSVKTQHNCSLNVNLLCGNKMPTRCNRWVLIADLIACSTAARKPDTQPAATHYTDSLKTKHQIRQTATTRIILSSSWWWA